MKKFIIISIMATSALTVNSQVRLSGNIGGALGVDIPSSSVVLSESAVAGIGCKFDNGLYFGVGIAPGMMTEFYHSRTTFMYSMPFYAQISYIKAKHLYGDFKIGGELLASSRATTGFYMNITPLGYSFNDKNSLGLGYRLQTFNGYAFHGVSLTYTYTFDLNAMKELSVFKFGKHTSKSLKD